MSRVFLQIREKVVEEDSYLGNEIMSLVLSVIKVIETVLLDSF